ncbi:MAG: acyl-CoA thioesterase [Deltaproteobacteria bacterium]|nr:acyl-CoA thioesterase [Deltaproteobacteria bacterium]
MRRTPTPSATKPFVLPYTVTEDDIDAQGRANNVAYIQWMNVAAIAHSHALGFDHQRFVALGAMFVVRRHEIDYRLPAFAGDVLELKTWPTLMRAATAHRAHEMVRQSDGAVIARGLNVWGYVAIDTGRPLRMPPEVLEAFDPAKFA